MAAADLYKSLMALDRGKLTEVPSMEVKAENLSRLLKKEVKVKVHAISGDSYSSYIGLANDKKGNVDTGRAYDTQALIVCEGLESIDLKDHDLQAHFGASTAKDLAKLIFPGGELTKLCNVIGYLSGFVDAETAGIDEGEKSPLDYETVKN